MAATREAAILGIDLGTTEVKAGLVTLDGRLLGLARTGYRTDTGAATGHAEQDPEAWWGALATSVRRLTSSAAAEVIAVAVDGHGPTLAAVDATGRPTRPAIIWQDSRSTAEAAELAAATGLAGWSLAGLPAALWVERNEPAVAAATCWYLATWDFLGLRLTGRAATSLVEGQPFPAAAVLDGAGVPAAKVPPAVRAGDLLGELTPAAADDLRLDAGMPVVAGLVDAWASFHGAGMTEKGDAIDVGGAAGGFGVYWDRPLVVPGSFATIAPLSGLFSALAAVFYVSTTTAGDANAGAPFILTSIASVVVGGVSFSGGRGSALGAMAGAVALTLVIDVIFFAGIEPLYQSLFQGLFLVVAVLLGTGAALVARVRKESS